MALIHRGGQHEDYVCKRSVTDWKEVRLRVDQETRGKCCFCLSFFKGRKTTSWFFMKEKSCLRIGRGCPKIAEKNQRIMAILDKQNKQAKDVIFIDIKEELENEGIGLRTARRALGVLKNMTKEKQQLFDQPIESYVCMLNDSGHFGAVLHSDNELVIP